MQENSRSFFMKKLKNFSTLLKQYVNDPEKILSNPQTFKYSQSTSEASKTFQNRFFSLLNLCNLSFSPEQKTFRINLKLKPFFPVNNLSSGKPAIHSTHFNSTFYIFLHVNLETIYWFINFHPFPYTFAEEDYDQFCLAYMFTYRDFEMGTLGLAWTGDLKNAGGVCEKNGVSLPKQFSAIVI